MCPLGFSLADTRVDSVEGWISCKGFCSETSVELLCFIWSEVNSQTSDTITVDMNSWKHNSESIAMEEKWRRVRSWLGVWFWVWPLRSLLMLNLHTLALILSKEAEGLATYPYWSEIQDQRGETPCGGATLRFWWFALRSYPAMWFSWPAQLI